MSRQRKGDVPGCGPPSVVRAASSHGLSHSPKAGWRLKSVRGLQTKKMGKPNHWFAHFNKRRYLDVKKKGYF